MKKIYVSILDYNSQAKTLACLASLEKIECLDFTLSVVIINNSPGTIINLKQEKYKNFSLHIINNKFNNGFAGGQNTGIEYALKQKADFILILNNDTIVSYNLLKNLLVPLINSQTNGISVPKIYFTNGHEFHKKQYKAEELGKIIWYAGGSIDWKNVVGLHRGVDEVDSGQYDTMVETETATGCCMLIKREVLEQTGKFDERYFLYYEDADLSMRVKKTGFKIIYQPDGIIWHDNAGSTGGSGSSMQDYYISRNRLLFGLTYAPLRTKFALLRECTRIFFTGRDWQKKGVRDFFFRRLGKGSFQV